MKVLYFLEYVIFIVYDYNKLNKLYYTFLSKKPPFLLNPVFLPIYRINYFFDYYFSNIIHYF